MSMQEVELVVNRSKSVPWALWIILFTMIVSFLFFGRFLTPNHKKLILSGKVALNKRNYSKAVKIYNELIDLNSNIDSNIRQDILDYLTLLRKKIGSSKIGLSLLKGSGGFPKIEFIIGCLSA